MSFNREDVQRRLDTTVPSANWLYAHLRAALVEMERREQADKTPVNAHEPIRVCGSFALHGDSRNVLTNAELLAAVLASLRMSPIGEVVVWTGDRDKPPIQTSLEEQCRYAKNFAKDNSRLARENRFLLKRSEDAKIGAQARAEARAAKLAAAIQRAEQAEARAAALQSELDAAWFGIERSFEIEPREVIEREAKSNGFKFGLAQAVHTIWKREPKVADALNRTERLKEALLAIDNTAEAYGAYGAFQRSFALDQIRKRVAAALREEAVDGDC